MKSLLIVAALAGIAHADSPPSKTLERAIKLYDRKDFFSASIELQKVLEQETGDDEQNKERARFFQAKTMFNMGFPIAAASMLRSITVDSNNAYRLAAMKWGVAILERVDADVPRASLGTITPADTDDPSLAAVADALRFYGGEIALEAHNTSGAEAFLARVERGSKYGRAAEVALVKLKHGADDVELLTDAAKSPNPIVVHAAVRELVAAKAQRALASVASTTKDAHTAFAASWLALIDRQPALAPLDLDAVEAAACAAGANDAAKLRDVAHDAAVRANEVRGTDGEPDNAEIFERVKRLAEAPTKTPAEGAFLAALGDTPEIAEGQALVAELDLELKSLMTADKAWQTTMVASQILQELTVITSVSQADLGKREAVRIGQVNAAFDAVARAMGSAPSLASLARPACGVTASGAPPVIAEPQAGSGATPRAGGAPARGCGCQSGGDAGAGLVGLVMVVAARRRRRIVPR